MVCRLTIGTYLDLDSTGCLPFFKEKNLVTVTLNALKEIIKRRACHPNGNYSCIMDLLTQMQALYIDSSFIAIMRFVSNKFNFKEKRSHYKMIYNF